MYIITIDDYTIPDEHIIKYPEILSQVYYEIGTSNIISQTIEIELVNYENIYSYQDSNSIFYNDTYYNKSIQIYDTETEIIVFSGRIKEIEIANNLTIKIIAANYLKDIIDTKIEYISTSQTTIAEHIYNIIVDYVGIDEQYLNKTSFDFVKAKQISLGIYCDVKITIEDNINALKAIEELLKIGCCELYYYNNLISIVMYENYQGQKGVIFDDTIISNVKIYMKDTIYNQYSIAYKSGTSVLYKETDYPLASVIDTSISKYNNRYFVVPDERINEPTTANMPILLQSDIAAKNVGNIIIDRYKNGLHYIDFDIDYKYINIINMNDIIIINYKDINNEPARIIGIKLNNQTKIIRLSCEFCNIPNNDYVIDKTKPLGIVIYNVIRKNDNEALITFSKSNDDVMWYELAFSTNGVDYELDYINIGGSPVKIIPSNCVDYGYDIYGYILKGFEKRKYYFKMRAVNNNMIYSDYSNIKEVTFKENINIENAMARTKYDGLKVSIDMSKNKYEMTSEDYGRIANIYKSVFGNYDVSYYDTVNYATMIKADINIYRDVNETYIMLMIRITSGRRILIYDFDTGTIKEYINSTDVIYNIDEYKRIIIYFDGYGWGSYSDYILIM